MRLLLLEAEPDLSERLLNAFVRQGFAVDCATSLRAAERLVRDAEHDLAVLDRQAADGDAVDLLQAIRASGRTTPIILLTARAAAQDCVRALDAGADDYVRKPAEVAELLARSRALLRRSRGWATSTLSVADVALDVDARLVRVEGRPVALGRRETALLEHLMRRPGRVVTRAALDGALYGSEAEVTQNSLEATVSRLRRHLAQAGAAATLHTVRGVGYFIA